MDVTTEYELLNPNSLMTVGSKTYTCKVGPSPGAVSTEGKRSTNASTASILWIESSSASSLLCNALDSWLRDTTTSFSCCRRLADCERFQNRKKKQTWEILKSCQIVHFGLGSWFIKSFINPVLLCCCQIYLKSSSYLQYVLFCEVYQQL